MVSKRIANRKFIRNVFIIFSSPERFGILMRLHLRGRHNYTQLKKKSYSHNKSHSLFAFELRVLTTNHLIYKHDYTGFYDLTDRGRNVLSLAIQLESEAKEKMLEDTVIYEDKAACLKLVSPLEINIA